MSPWSRRKRRTSSSVRLDLPDPPVPVMPSTGAVFAAAFDMRFSSALANMMRDIDLLLVPAMILFLVQAPQIRETDLSSLRLIVYGAAPIPADLLRQAMSIFKCGFQQVYGLTETTGAITLLPPEDHDPADARKLLSCGYAQAGVELRIVGDDRKDRRGLLPDELDVVPGVHAEDVGVERVLAEPQALFDWAAVGGELLEHLHQHVADDRGQALERLVQVNCGVGVNGVHCFVQDDRGRVRHRPSHSIARQRTRQVYLV